MVERPDAAHVDKILREQKRNAMEYLRVFYASGSGAQFLQCARTVGVSEATFARGIHDLDERITKLTGGASLLRRTTTGYELTTAGVQLGELLTEQRLQLYEMLDEASESLTVRVRLSKDCWPEFRALVEAAASADVTILPTPVSSTTLNLHEPGSAQPETLARSHGIYTTCQDISNLEKDDHGRVTLKHMPATEIIVTRMASFELVLRANIFGAGKTTISYAELVDSGISLLLPEEGAVMDYVNLLEPKWSSSRIKRHSAGTDFDHCRGALLCGSYPRSAMIVHGPAAKQFPKGYTALALTDMPDVKAVTGFYRRVVAGAEKPWPNATEAAWMTVWKRAHDRWPVKGEG